MGSIETDAWGNPEDRFDKAMAWLDVARDLVKDDPDFDGIESYLDTSVQLVSVSPEIADVFAQLTYARSRSIVTMGIDPLNLQIIVLPIAIERILEQSTRSNDT